MTRETDTDKRLWRRAAEARSSGAQASETDPMLLAAYLDGTLEESEREAFEARLAAEPELLESMVAARAALGARPGEVPASAVARAQAIVGHAGRVEAPRRGGFLGRALGGWRQPLAWAAVGALALIVTGAGFEIGRESYDAVVEMRTVMSETLAFDFPDPASDLIL